ncbi:S8 family peptidase [Nonomuraea guangzhouensis]|uniref:S8 family serine peptidase n=1 Tax=Nonomuraea guangzhouensis TaxID=1291555 RepID=A0ABW4GHP9_9ACTN|nr:S8 family serine peptidase [Nonomuraea guangzhouensis]
MNRRLIRRIIAVAAILFSSMAVSADVSASAQSPWVEPGLAQKLAGGARTRVNVVTKARADLPAAASAGQVLQTLSVLPVVTLRADQAALERLAAQPGVVSVSEDRPVPPALGPSTALIGADRTRAAGLTGEGSVVAVLDTGVAVNHPFLGGRVVAEACFSPIDPDYSATSLCPDGTAQQDGPGSADSESGPCAAVDLDCDHGTHVAGIVAGDGEGLDGDDGSGVAPGADIAAIQVFSKFDTEDFCGVGGTPCVLSFTSAQLAGLENVLELKGELPIVAANLSLGGGRYTAACDTDPRKPAIDNLLAAGVATVIAAGNNGYPDAISAPACVSSAVAVGSSTNEDAVSSFSNRGPLLDLFAPGSDIISSVPGDEWRSMSGTSMAAPHVAGALAVLRQAFPNAGVAELVSMLKENGRSISYPIATTPRIQLDDAALDANPRPGPDQYFHSRGRILDNVQISANSTMAVQVTGVAGLPAEGIRAVALNIAAKGDWFNSGSVAVYASDQQEPEGNTLFYDPNRWASTMVIAKVGTDGKIKLVNRSAAPARVTLDVHGHTRAQAATTVGGTYLPISPVRVADRTVIPAWGNVQLTTSAMTGLPTSGVDTVALTVMVKSSATGTIRAYAAGDVYPVDANIDYPANVAAQFFTIVKPGSDGKINLHNLGANTVEISVDVSGYYTAAQRGSTVKAIRPASVAKAVTITAGGTRVLTFAGVPDIPASGVSAVGLTIAAKATTAGVVSVVPPSGPSTARVVAYAAGKDTTGFTTAALRKDGTVVLKNEGTSQVTVSVDAYAYFPAR